MTATFWRHRRSHSKDRRDWIWFWNFVLSAAYRLNQVAFSCCRFTACGRTKRRLTSMITTRRLQTCLLVRMAADDFNPFTPTSDQFQSSPAASPEIQHQTAWRTWLFLAYPDERWLYYQFSLPHLYIFSLKGRENVPFELGSERVKSRPQCFLVSM